MGYKNLEVNLTYGAGSLRTLVDVKYSDRVDSSLFDVKLLFYSALHSANGVFFRLKILKEN